MILSHALLFLDFEKHVLSRPVELGRAKARPYNSGHRQRAEATERSFAPLRMTGVAQGGKGRTEDEKDGTVIRLSAGSSVLWFWDVKPNGG